MFNKLFMFVVAAAVLCFAVQSADAGNKGNFVSRGFHGNHFHGNHVFNGFGYDAGFNYGYVPQVLVFPVGYNSGYGAGVSGYGGACGVGGYGGYGVGVSPFVSGYNAGFGYGGAFHGVRFVKDRFGRLVQVRGFGY